jgi:hypothetical protein
MGPKKKGLRFRKPLISLSGAAGDRTPDLMTASHALSHLSYSPNALVRGNQEYRSYRRLSRVAQAVQLPLEDAEQIGESISPLHADPATGMCVVRG